MNTMDPVADYRYQPLQHAARKIARLVPAARFMELPPQAGRDSASVGLEIPAPTVILNGAVRQALSFLFAQCDSVQVDKTETSVCYTFTLRNLPRKEG